MKAKQFDKQTFETLILEMQQTISCMDQLIKKYKIKTIKIDLPNIALEFSDINKLKVGIIGSNEINNFNASKKIKSRYNNIKLNLRVNGYEDKDYIIKKIKGK